jgi:hypothetical protein
MADPARARKIADRTKVPSTSNTASRTSGSGS